MPDVSLPKRRVGCSDLEITCIGLGTRTFGEIGWAAGERGVADDRRCIATVRRAVERGINWIDVAPIYGRGRAEELVARALEGLSPGERPLLSTKIGVEWDGRSRLGEPRFVASPKRLRCQIEASLTRLRVERIDLLQVHWPPTDGTVVEDYWAELVDLRQAGKVRAIGLANHDVEALERAERIGHVDSFEPTFSLVRRDAALLELPWCDTHATAVLVSGPLEGGRLARGAEPALVAALANVARRRACSPAAVAVAWALAWSGITGAIVGASSPEQIDDWAVAASIEFSPRDLSDLAKAIAATGIGSGPVHPHRFSEAA